MLTFMEPEAGKEKLNDVFAVMQTDFDVMENTVERALVETVVGVFEAEHEARKWVEMMSGSYENYVAWDRETYPRFTLHRLPRMRLVFASVTMQLAPPS